MTKLGQAGSRTKVPDRATRDRGGAKSSDHTAAKASSHPSTQEGEGHRHTASVPRPLVWLVGILGLVIVGLTAAIALVPRSGENAESGLAATAIPKRYDPDRAFGYLEEICRIGPRSSASRGMLRQREMLQSEFTKLGAKVTLQTFEIRHPENGSAVPMANLIASWHSERPKRFLLCAHYDTRPYPDQDRRNKFGTFIGANDGGSGTAALLELAHQLGDLPPDVGIDMVLFDGEEFVFRQGRDDYFLGSTFFARKKYRRSPPAIPYRAGVLLDMVGDKELLIYYEKNSLKFARKVAQQIWATADRLGVRAFVPRARHEIKDDHIPLNRIARIPTVDVIDFDYPRFGFRAPSYWHTEQDVPANCSGQSLAAVVWVIHEWLLEQ